MSRFRQFITQKVKSFKQQADAMAAVEFALIAPILIVILFGGIELTNYIVKLQGVDRAAYGIAGVVSQYSPATEKNLALEISVNKLNQEIPLTLTRTLGTDTQRQAVIVTSLERDRGGISMRWQRFWRGGAVGNITSIASNRTPRNTVLADTCTYSMPTVPYSMYLSWLPATSNIIVVEVFYSYQPIVNRILNLPLQQSMSRAVFIQPRSGALLHLPPVVPVTRESCTI